MADETRKVSPDSGVDSVEETNTTKDTMKEHTPAKTSVVDEFLEKHGVALPGHILDFALDVRSVIAELEQLLDSEDADEPELESV